MKLARQLLLQAKEGVNMNLLAFWNPDLIFIGNASKHGLGGFDTSGRAWSFVILDKLRGKAHINLLEFLTQLVGVWLAIEEG